MNKMRRVPVPKWLSGVGSVDKRHDAAAAMLATKSRNVRREVTCVGLDMLQSVTNTMRARAIRDETFTRTVRQRGTGDDSIRPAHGTTHTQTVVLDGAPMHSTLL